MTAPPDLRPGGPAALLAWATEQLLASGVPEPERDARLLVDDAFETLQATVRRRAAREPLEYVRRRATFRGLELEVDARVFIPRPETELLVEAALRLPRGVAVVEPCTGSGAVALALKHERPDLDVTATDRNPDAVEVASANAGRLRLDVRFAVAEGIVGSFDAVVCNPPYVAETQAGTGALPPELERHEPPEAFWAGADGLALYRRLIAQVDAANFVAFEVGDGQADAVLALLAGRGLHCTRRLAAPSGATRVIVAERAAA